MRIALYVPCFNAEKTIQACLEAALHQSHPADEIMVVDDGSTDMTVKITKSYPVKIISRNSNRGLAAARNIAIRNTDCEFIASLDSDCKADKDWLKFLVKDMRRTDIAGVGGRVNEEDTSHIFDLWRSVHMRQHWGPARKVNPPFLFGSNTLFRREALIKAGFYNEDYGNNFEDVDISGRLRKSGYKLIYEPLALALHLKEDDLFSLFNTFWRWNLAFYIKKGFYGRPARFSFKIKDNIGLANRFLEEDIRKRRTELLYLDFLMALHHSLRDFDYFNFYGRGGRFNIDAYSKAPLWLSLLDLTFFYHFDRSKREFSSLMPRENSFKQNLIATNLLLSGFIGVAFRSQKLRQMVLKHLFLSLYRTDDEMFLEKLSVLSELRCDWEELLKKRQMNLNRGFLRTLSMNFRKWAKNLTQRSPRIIKLIENSARETEKTISAH